MRTILLSSFRRMASTDKLICKVPKSRKITSLTLPVAPAGKSTGKADQYLRGNLHRSDLVDDPFTQFHEWYSHAKENVHQPETVCLSTASLPSGAPSSRFVYLKELDSRGFVIYSNWDTSRKAADVKSNPQASLAFWWHELERQIRVEGSTERLSREESQCYFDVRARGSQIGAWASPQSSVLKDRDELEQRVKAVETRFEGKNIEVPDFWGGLRIVPSMIEFWQGRDSRLHDRFRYTREGGSWKIERLSP